MKNSYYIITFLFINMYILMISSFMIRRCHYDIIEVIGMTILNGIGIAIFSEWLTVKKLRRWLKLDQKL